MSDINAKRDARRRRILENSEKRLSKITALNGNIKPEDTPSQTSFIYRGTQEELQQNINETCYDGIKNTNIFHTDSVYSSMLIPPKDKYKDIRTETETINSTLTRTHFSIPLVVINRLNYILLAFIINILLALKLDYLFGKTVIIPYLPMMLTRLYKCSIEQERQDASLLYTALILCNIKPDIIYQFKKFVTVLNMLIKDLVVYIFSFTVIYYTFFHCLYKTDTLTILNV